MSDTSGIDAERINEMSMAKRRRKNVIVGAREALRIAVHDAMRDARHGHADALLMLAGRAEAWLGDGPPEADDE